MFGVCDALASIGFGFIIKFVGRFPIVILGACINITAISVMLSWTSSTSSVIGLHIHFIHRSNILTHVIFLVVYLLAALWGTADAAWQTQINSLYGVLFKTHEEAAFSNYKLW